MNKIKNMVIIFTCSGRRNYLISYFKEILGEKGTTIALDSLSTAPSLQVADIGIVVPKISSKNYIPKLKNIISKYKADAIIPLNDLELPLLSKHRISIEALGAKVFISNEEIVNKSLDKWECYHFLKSLGLNTPKTFISVEAVQSALQTKAVRFPLILKPRWGSSSIDIYKVHTIEELKLVYQLIEMRQNFSHLKSLNVNKEIKFIVIQEYLQGQEFGMDILNDFEGNFVDTFVRKKIVMRAGETDQATTIIDFKLNSIAKILSKGTRHLGLIDCDFFISNNTIFILEINMRFGGGYPFTHLAGANIPAVYISWLLSEKDIKKHLNYQAGLTFAKYDTVIKIK